MENWGIKYRVITRSNSYVNCWESNNSNVKLRHKIYCKILTDVINTAKSIMTN